MLTPYLFSSDLGRGIQGKVRVSREKHSTRLVPFVALGEEGRRNQIAKSKAFGRLALPDEKGTNQ